MIVEYKLNIDSHTISFGIADSDEELSDVFRQRCKVYTKYRYIDNSSCDDFQEKDTYDEQSIHIVARGDDGTLLGSVRLIYADPLPINSCFKFGAGSNFPVSSAKLVEFSRLVVSREGYDYIPRNIIMIFMMKVLADVCIKNNWNTGLAYIKDNLLRKMSMLNMPFTKITEYKCVYSRTGFMSKYFYKKGSPVVPIYLGLDKFVGYLDGIIDNKRVFGVVNNVYTLNKTMYTKFLIKVGIL